MSGCPFASRRGFLAAAGGLAGALAARAAGAQPSAPTDAEQSRNAPSGIEPFWGVHQAGILTAPQRHTYFAAFDVTAGNAADLAALLRVWTDAAARMTAGEAAPPSGADAGDSGEEAGLPPARLTLTFGFGPALFGREGQDRLGLAARRPEPLVELPRFNGDQLAASQSGGDLSVQACAEDPQAAFHAVRQLARLSYGAAQLRWAEAGFTGDAGPTATPRNLMGFKDGTQNPVLTGANRAFDARQAAAVVFAGAEAPDWMRDGSYVVVRRIRMALEHWDRTGTAFQEQVIGRRKATGAPLGGRGEFDLLDLDTTDASGNSLIPDDAHVRLAAAATNGGAQILRRGYAYDNGVDFIAERWPPWRQGMEFDAGLLFIAYQRDPRAGFIRIYENMAKLDALNQFTTHNASALFACPGGARPGEFIGQRLFQTA